MATPETNVELESRVAILEAKVESLQRELKAVAPDRRPWLTTQLLLDWFFYAIPAFGIGSSIMST